MALVGLLSNGDFEVGREPLEGGGDEVEVELVLNICCWC